MRVHFSQNINSSSTRSHASEDEIRTSVNGLLECSSRETLESLRLTIYDARPAQRRGLNFNSRMSAKQFDYCNKYELTLFQIALQTAKFG